MRDHLTEDVKSLVGKIDKQAMGLNASRSKPVKKEKKTVKKMTEREFKGGDFFTQNFDETIYYRPKTKENKIIYENYLGRVYELVQDQPPQQLHSIADEILAIIRGDQPDAKKRIYIQTIIGAKIKQDTFIDLCNVAKSLSDYSIEAQEGFNDIIAINEDEQSENQQQEDEIIEEEEVQIEQNEQMQIKKQNKKEEMEIEEKQEGLDVTSIDAHWIEAQLLNYYDATQAQRLAKEILSVLNGKVTLQVENNLLSILNYERFQLVSLFLKNRKAIYYCVKYHQTQNEREKEHILEEMKQEGIVLAKKKNKNVQSVQRSRRENEGDEQHPVFRAARDDEILRINKKIIDLNIHDIQDRTANKQQYKFRLPEGAEKIERVGYEEVHIPASLKTVNETLIDVESLPLWMQPVFSGYKRFNPIQSRVLPYALYEDGNMLVCAPTSAGKTFVALLTILKAISQYRDQDAGSIDYSKFKVVYIAPMKALVSEITGNLSNRLKTLGITVKQLTGDVHLSRSQIEETQVIISTPEKWDIITRKTGERMFVEQVKLMIIDEIHLLSDSRGPVLESIIARSIRKTEAMQQNTRIVGLSATLPNYKDVGACLRVKKEGLFYFDQSYRPIPLEQRYIGVTQKKGVRKMLMINQILYQKVMERVGNFQMIIFVHSRRDTVRTANYIKDTAFAKNELNRLMRPESQSKKILESIIEKQGLNSKDLKELLPSGIAVHHAGLSRQDRTMVQQLFGDRHINVLVSTATLAWGVNLPAHTVIIKGTQVYSPEEGRWVQLSLQDVMQMLGRAGRPRFDTEGQGIILTGYEQVRYYLNLLNMQIPLQSQMLRSLADQLNAEVVEGSVTNLRDAVNWMSFTYLYIRMLRNPKHYGIAGDEMQEDRQLLKRRVNLAHSAFSLLQRNGLVNYDRKNGIVSANFLGKIASYYYIKYPSMSIYNSNLKSSSNIIQLLRIFAMSIEFKYLVVRQQEKNELKKLIQTVPVPIKGTVQEVTTKISALLQAHISKLNMQGFALNIDKVYVSQSASRIMRALFEITLKRGWGMAAQRTLELAKMIDRSMWSCLNPLRQFKQIPEYVLSRLQKKEQFSWQSFYQMNPQEIGELTRFPKLGKILHKFVHHVPRVQIQAYAQPLTRSCLKVDLTATSDFKWEDQYHGREQPFWLFVLDCNQQTILYSYYFTLSKHEQSFSTQFIVPLFEIMHPLYYIKVISDRWICADNVLPLSFKSMVLPTRFSQPQQLLDLQPIPANSLDPVAKQLKISYLNQIQTQAYSAFVNSQSNVFLGASEGSGKFSLAVLAMSQTLHMNKKVVVVVSHKVIAQKKTAFLTKVFHKKKVGRTFEDLNKDSQILANSDIIITTPEAWDVLTRRWKSRKGFTEVGLIVIDNLHLLGQGNSTLEVVISRMRYISSQLGQTQDQNGQSVQKFRLICLSASLADYKEVAEWIGSPPENTFNFHPSVRPNSVEIVFNSFDQPFRQTRLHMMQKQLMQSILHYNRNCLVVVNDKKQARITALDLVSELSTEANPKRLKHINDKLFETISRRISDQYLLHLIEYGIAYIYEGMPEMERQMVDELFKAEGISVLVVTQSLKWELDFKVFMVAVLDTTYFEPKTRRWVDYSIPEMAQLMSLPAVFERDRQKGKDFSNAKFVIFCQSAKKAFYKKFLLEPYPLQSALHHNLHNHFNSAVVAKSISNKGEGVDWLTWTFMYRRLINNPNFYNMDEANEQSISLYLSDLIDQTTEYLVHIKCLQSQQEEDSLAATNLGIICSYYYIKVETLAVYVQKITETMKLKDIIEVVSQAHELADFQYKPREYEIIAQYLTQVGQKPLNKPHGLILLHLYRIQMTAELNHELRTMLPLCVKLTHALVDVISSLGYLKPLIFCMQFCQILVQAMWINQSPLLQIMDKATSKVLNEQYEVKDIAEFLDMDEKTREKALKGKDIDKIAEACNRYPALNLEYTLGQQEDDEMEISVKLSRDEPLDTDFVIANYYPQEKEQFWWVIVGDKKSNKVLTTKRILVHEKAELNLSFEVGDCRKITIYALCDSYVGCDQAEEVEISESD